VSVPYWQLHITLTQGEAHRQFIHKEEFKDKAAAEAVFGNIGTGSQATVTRLERKRVFRQPPLLYDLTSLQKDCNTHYDLTAEKTLSIAQSLYEKKLISYPRTGSRHIPEDVMRIIPSLLEKIISISDFKALSSLREKTPHHPGRMTEEERERKTIPSQVHSMVSCSFSQGGEKDSSILPAIRA